MAEEAWKKLQGAGTDKFSEEGLLESDNEVTDKFFEVLLNNPEKWYNRNEMAVEIGYNPSYFYNKKGGERRFKVYVNNDLIETRGSDTIDFRLNREKEDQIRESISDDLY